MKRRGVYQGLFFSLLVGVVMMCASCKTQQAPQPGSAATASEVEKCRLPLSADGSGWSCDLSKGNKEIVVFVNRDSKQQDLYVCAENPKDTVFDAYSWYIPYSEKRKSRVIRDDFSPDPASTAQVNYDVSTTPCGPYAPIAAGASANLSAKTMTNPKIIIKASN
jgi:hypothetical protein